MNITADLINLLLAIGTPAIAFVAWLIRLESVSKQNAHDVEQQKQDLVVIKAKVEVLEDKVMDQLMEIKVTLAKIMGRLNIEE